MVSDAQEQSTSPQSSYSGATALVSSESVPGPLKVGKYEIVNELGSGGMGIVYKAFDPGIGRIVALKLMSPQLAQDADFRNGFLREAREAGILQHPNIVTVYELAAWEGAPFMAMEFLKDRSLRVNCPPPILNPQ
jgi:serine/threonine-protein kinase